MDEFQVNACGLAIFFKFLTLLVLQ
jgi:hypothetical protein